MEYFLALLLDLLITALVYLLVPLIFYFRGKTLTLSKIRKIVIINGICVWLAFTIVKSLLDISQASAAVFVWSFVAYKLMTKTLLIEENTENDETEATQTIQPSQATRTVQFCRKCGAKALNDAVFCSHCGSKLHWEGDN